MTEFHVFPLPDGSRRKWNAEAQTEFWSAIGSSNRQLNFESIVGSGESKESEIRELVCALRPRPGPFLIGYGLERSTWPSALQHRRLRCGVNPGRARDERLRFLHLCRSEMQRLGAGLLREHALNSSHESRDSGHPRQAPPSAARRMSRTTCVFREMGCSGSSRADAAPGRGGMNFWFGR
jgi:hypothetical protein